MALNFTKWDKRVADDLYYRMGTFDEGWKRNDRYIRNEYEGRLYGNLVRDFERVVFNRVVNRSGTIKVYADDNSYTEAAQTLEIVANAICRIVKLKENLRQATFLSTYSMGWLYTGHSFAAFGVDPRRYAPLITNVLDPSSIESQWEEVDPQVVNMRGIDMTQISAFDLNTEYLTEEGNKPEPVFNDGGIGYPYLEYVHGRQMVTQRKVRAVEDSDYVARLRCVTKDELKMLLDEDSTIDWDNLERISPRYYDLFDDIDFDFIDAAYMIVECWIKRDRNDASYNNWFACWNFGQPSQVIRNRRNPWGGMVPCTPVSVSKMGRFLDRTLVDDLIHLAQMYSVTLQSLERDMKDALNPKVLVGGAAQIEDDEVKRLLNPGYRGKVDVGGRPEDIKIHRGEGIDQSKIIYARFLRELAQQNTNTSEIDRGQPIKKITARQTQALLEATDTVMSGMRGLVAEAAAEVTFKVLHILHIFHGEKKNFEYGGAVVKFDPSATDFVTSAIYRIQVTELGPEASIEDAMLMIQALRGLSATPEIKQKLNYSLLAKQFAKAMRWPEDVVNEEMAMPNLGAPEGVLSAIDQRAPGEQTDSTEAPVMFNALQGANR